MSTETTQVIRPAALLSESAARRVLAALKAADVGAGGVWNASPGLWQRYDLPWDGPAGMAGSARLIGTIGVVYDTPSRYQITVYRATVSAYGAGLGWTVDALCDEALSHAGLTLASCPRAELLAPPGTDPFR